MSKETNKSVKAAAKKSEPVKAVAADPVRKSIAKSKVDTASMPAAPVKSAPVKSAPPGKSAAPASTSSAPVVSAPVVSAPASKAAPTKAKPFVTHETIAQRAYFIAMSGTGGSEVDNWLRAEAELRS